MRGARTRRRAAALAVPTAALLLGGCGIQETDVIAAGSPATVQAFLNRDSDMLLFFRSPDGDLLPVLRTTKAAGGFGSGYQDLSGAQPGPAGTEEAVLALLGGPGDNGRAAGLGTSLPPADPGGTVTVEVSPGGLVTADVPVALGGLDSTARRQLICTIAYSQDVDGQVTVRLRGQDAVSESGTCGLAPGTRTLRDHAETRARTAQPDATGQSGSPGPGGRTL
ncbi:hypothetical protein AB0O67_08185 [Streptomyces sp. NPDC086077]|uniref:hypothetical protein n=1 Tax=Streptomyces sp. NPDC086077 TaxID=3154862 RepID=UPI0034467422